MKRFISILVVLILVLAFTVPVMAETTTVTISSGGGQIPIIKCKWEAEPNNNLTYLLPEVAPPVTNNLESGDPGHGIALSQFNPPMHKNATKTIQYYAVVTDAEDMGSVASVFALVFHPIDSPAPYGTFTGAVPDPDSAISYANLFKYKVEFTKLGHAAAQINLVLAANNAGLITFNSPYDIDEIAGNAEAEMNKGTADLWRGTAEIDYEQPGGYYTVRDYAIDANNNLSAVLENQFLYVETAGVEVDFDSFDYGPINLKRNIMRAGDLDWDDTTPFVAGFTGYGATVRNIGNMWTKIKITQSDMTFGDHSGSNANSAYLGTTAPTDAQSNWNVWFDVRLGNTGQEIFYDPDVTATTQEFLGLSTLEELDFSIYVYQGAETHTGTMTIAPEKVAFGTGTPVGTPDP